MNRFAFAAAAFLLMASLSHAQFNSEPRYDVGAVSALVDRVHTPPCQH
jgi:hypothetical protein